MSVRRALALVAAAACLGAALPAAAADERARWDTDVFALIPPPGFSAHAYAARNGRVYAGTYTNPRGDSLRSRVFEYERDGTLLRSWTVRGQDLSGEQGVQVATMDPRGRLLLLDRSPPRVIRLSRRNGSQRTIARFPDGAVPNHAAWGPDGALYVTDFENPRIWRVRRRSGKPDPWLESAELGGASFGATAITLAADRRSFLVGQMSAAGGGAGNPATGRLLTVAIDPDGTPGDVRRFWESRPLDGVDGFAIARSGNVYVALLVSSQLVLVGPDGMERERFPPAPFTGANGSSVPFDAPSSVRFVGTRLMVANQALFSGDPARQAILDVEAGEQGLREYVPPKPRTARGRARRPGRPTAHR